MTALTLEEVQAHLPEIIDRLRPGESLVITRDDRPVATLVGERPDPAVLPRPGPGLCRGAVVYMAHDFDTL